MNVDRVPDSPDDPGPPAETPRLNEEPQPETNATSDNPRPSTPEPEHPPTPDEQSHPEQGPQTDQPDPIADAAPRDTPDARGSTEPRSRQEHAEPAPADEGAGAVDGGAEDRISDTTAESANDVPRSADHQGEVATKEDIGTVFAGEHAPENPMSGGTFTQEDGAAEEGNHQSTESEMENEDLGKRVESLANQDYSQSGDAEDSRSVDEALTTSGEDTPAEGDQIYPLTDLEWTEHLTDVRNILDKARAAGLTTDRLYTINGMGEIWSEEREVLHDSIIHDIYAGATNVPCDSEAIVAGGLGGAGKSTVLAEHAGIDLSQYLIINPDNIKEQMARRGMLPELEGLSPMEASDLSHEESSHIAKRLARRAQADGKNLIWDITMSSKESATGRVDALREAGYRRVDGLFVEIPTDTSIRRTESRHREGHDKWRAGEGLGGRFIPPEVIDRQKDLEWGSQNRKTYEATKGRFDQWSTYDNSVDGRSPSIIESSESAKPKQHDGRRISDGERSH